jgi:hypothetical protein
MTEELLIQSANQSLLADMLAALTCPEGEFSHVASSGDDAQADEDGGDVVRRTGLVLSRPALCMTSVAETCWFKVDLTSGVAKALCLLAMSVPYHHRKIDNNGGGAGGHDGAAEALSLSSSSNDGRHVLSRAEVLVRFRPGGEDVVNDESTVQYAVRSVTLYHVPDSAKFRRLGPLVGTRRSCRTDPSDKILTSYSTDTNTVVLHLLGP